MWWHILVIPDLGRERQEDQNARPSLATELVRGHHMPQKNKTNKNSPTACAKCIPPILFWKKKIKIVLLLHAYVSTQRMYVFVCVHVSTMAHARRELGVPFHLSVHFRDCTHVTRLAQQASFHAEPPHGTLPCFRFSCYLAIQWMFCGIFNLSTNE